MRIAIVLVSIFGAAAYAAWNRREARKAIERWPAYRNVPEIVAEAEGRK